MEFHCLPWKPLSFHGFPIDFHGNPWDISVRDIVKDEFVQFVSFTLPRVQVRSVHGLVLICLHRFCRTELSSRC